MNAENNSQIAAFIWSVAKKNKKTILKTGDLVTMCVGYLGVTTIVPLSCEDGNRASVMLVKRGDFDYRWLCAVMNNRLIRQQVEVVQYGAAKKQFSIADAVEFWLLKPPQTEQVEVADFIAAKSANFDQLMDKVSQSIDLLAKRRSALISATGNHQQMKALLTRKHPRQN